MTIQYKLMALAAAVALVAALAAGTTYHYMSKRLSEAKARYEVAEQTLRANAAAMAAKDRALAKLRKQHAEQDKELANALKANPEWADSRVPDAVFDSLFPDQASPAE